MPKETGSRLSDHLKELPSVLIILTLRCQSFDEEGQQSALCLPSLEINELSFRRGLGSSRLNVETIHSTDQPLSNPKRYARPSGRYRQPHCTKALILSCFRDPSDRFNGTFKSARLCRT